MRTLGNHKVNPVNEQLTIEVTDEPGAGGACHSYMLRWPGDAIELRFQNGPIAEVGVNGITHEALLAVLIDRLEHFQAGPYACHENLMALESLRNAQGALHARTMARIERGVEGTHTI